MAVYAVRSIACLFRWRLRQDYENRRGVAWRRGHRVRQRIAVSGQLDARRLNWRPDAQQWSIAQCFDHLLNANRLMLAAADAALTGAAPRTIWQRLPLLPGVLGRALIRSQSPDGRRKYTAPLQARPSASDLAPDIVRRFVEQQREAARKVQSPRQRACGADHHDLAVRAGRDLQRAGRLADRGRTRPPSCRAGEARVAGSRFPRDAESAFGLSVRSCSGLLNPFSRAGGGMRRRPTLSPASAHPEA